MTTRIEIGTSHGHFECDETGKVVAIHLDSSFGTMPKRVDLETYRRIFGEVPEYIDVLNVGFWDFEDKYEGPELEYLVDSVRQPLLELISEMNQHLSVATPADVNRRVAKVLSHAQL